jgi:UDP-3-O-acyl N-acetylglucosamine deacetylase
MKTLRKQRTIARPAEVMGFGYWSGKNVRVEFRPAHANSGITFVRGDLQHPRRIPAAVEHRIEVPRRTALAADGCQVEMVEHILAALYGLSIDNCDIWVDGQEMPGCDGSAQPFVAALDAAAIVEQPALRRRLVVTDITRVGDDDSWIEARPLPTGRLSLKYKLDYGQNNPIGKQALDVVISAASFRQELAPARTFLFQEEADWLRQRGLGARVTNQDLLVFGPEGPIDNPLRFENECVRHKTLDLLGDLSLSGCDLAGQFIAHKSGHRLNAELVRVLLKEGQMEQGLRRTG